MNIKFLLAPLPILLLAIVPAARAQELDTILPDAIPGYGTPFAVTAEHQPKAPATGERWGAVTLTPSLLQSAGYDSAPNGANGSAALNTVPSLLVTDQILGLGAFAALNTARYPQAASQNTTGATVAIGERAKLPRETFTVAVGFLRDQETGFALNTVAIQRPLAFTVQDFRASDEVSAGMFTLKPEFSTTYFSVPSLNMQNRTDTREGFTLAYLPGGPVQGLLRLHATQSQYHEPFFNADTNQVLAGIEDTADGLWTFSALAGIAQRRPRAARAITAPVLEFGLDWMPTELDRLRLTLAREIDDPDEVSATAYTLSETNVSMTHEFLTDITLSATAKISRADYLHSDLQETLYNAGLNATWQASRSLGVAANYTFHDRQANYLRAANEHLITLGLTWTP